MAIEKLTEFAKTGQKDTDQLDIEVGFIVNKKPARQWFNWLFNTLTLKINEIIDADYIPKVDLVDNLTTDDSAKPVSAKQAKILQETKFKSNGSMPVSSDFPAWNSVSGVYTKANENGQQIVLQFLGTGSVPSVQFLVDYSNGGISYRSARDTLGFEKPFEKLVTESSGKAIAAAAADTAEKLKNPRSINGVDFDGSSNISLPMLGRGQSHASTSKAGNTNYVNSGSAPIFEKLIVRGGEAQINVWIGGNRVTGGTVIPLNQIVFIDFIVPPGQAYAVTTNSNQILEWSSLS